jgi:hypothetical protein
LRYRAAKDTVTVSATFTVPISIEYGLTPNSEWRHRPAPSAARRAVVGDVDVERALASHYL